MRSAPSAVPRCWTRSRALRLDGAEREHRYLLAGLSPPVRAR
ncbi:hypothetical protein [Nonomuraea deserti]|nr:hypothetical protein [Nonomuraea deserti]